MNVMIPSTAHPIRLTPLNIYMYWCPYKYIQSKELFSISLRDPVDI